VACPSDHICGLLHTWELSFFSVFSFFFFSAKEGNGHYWRKKEGKKKEKKEIVKNLEKCDKIVPGMGYVLMRKMIKLTGFISQFLFSSVLYDR